MFLELRKNLVKILLGVAVLTLVTPTGHAFEANCSTFPRKRNFLPCNKIVTCVSSTKNQKGEETHSDRQYAACLKKECPAVCGISTENKTDAETEEEESE